MTHYGVVPGDRGDRAQGSMAPGFLKKADGLVAGGKAGITPYSSPRANR